jgi:DtxR family Mn-dependent transcriptional regulator
MMANQSTVSASLEDYLEAIYHTAQAKGAARAKDIVQAMGVNNSSVTQALRLLSEKKLVNYAPYEVITLTSAGETIALDVVRRHETLRDFLIKVLGLDPSEADAEACRMEHATSRTILDRLVKFVEYFETCPMNEVHWDDEIGFFCGERQEKGGRRDTCGRDGCGHDLHLPPHQVPQQRKTEG